MNKEKIKMYDDPFQVLEELSSLGNKSKEINISENFKLKVSTLDSDSEGEILKTADQFEEAKFITEYRKTVLTYSISEINGKSLRLYEKIEDVDERKRVKLETLAKIKQILDKWNDQLIAYVYSEYVKLTKEVEEELTNLGIIKPKDDIFSKIINDNEETSSEEQNQNDTTKEKNSEE